MNSVAQQSGADHRRFFPFFPRFHLGWTTDALWTLPVITFLFVSGGAVVGQLVSGGGTGRRRICSAAHVQRERRKKFSGRDAVVQHRALRDALWPWILTGLVAVAVYSPHGGLRPSLEFAAEPEKGYVMVLRDFLPPALRGLMIAAFLAAFMSTWARN